MTELIVLGTIPGTTIQINFSFWLMTIAMLANIMLLAYAYRNRSTLNRWLAGYILAFALVKRVKQPRLTA